MTAVIQSSSATTVMVVGFVNSGIMKLSQVIGIIMGANIGTTVTSWILSLSGIESSNFFVRPVEAFFFFAGVGGAWRSIFDVFQKGQEAEYRADSGRICDSHVRNGEHERCHEASGRYSGICRDPDFVFPSGSGDAERGGSDSGDSEFFCVCGHSAGAVRHGSRLLRNCDTDHHGAEYRYLRDRRTFQYWSKQECETSGAGSSLF